MELCFRGVDDRGIPFSFLKGVQIKYDNEKNFISVKG